MNTLVFTNFDDYNWLKHNFNSSEFDQTQASQRLQSAMRFDQTCQLSVKIGGMKSERMVNTDMYEVLQVLHDIIRPDLYVLAYALEKKGNYYYAPQKPSMHICIIDHLQNKLIYETEIDEYFPDMYLPEEEFCKILEQNKKKRPTQQDLWNYVFTFLIEKNCK